MAHVVRSRVLQVFEREPVQVLRSAHQLGVQGPQDAQDVYGILSIGSEVKIRR